MHTERQEIFEGIRQRLRNHRELLRRRLDGARSTANRSNSSNVRHPILLELESTEQAISKLREGTYGTCEGCGGDIAGERLEVLPFATCCIQCQLDESNID